MSLLQLLEVCKFHKKRMDYLFFNGFLLKLIQMDMILQISFRGPVRPHRNRKSILKISMSEYCYVVVGFAGSELELYR